MPLEVLHEDYIRTVSGSVGLMQNSCSHRGAPPFFGRNEEKGLRCVYHGWKFERQFESAMRLEVRTAIRICELYYTSLHKRLNIWELSPKSNWASATGAFPPLLGVL